MMNTFKLQAHVCAIIVGLVGCTSTAQAETFAKFKSGKHDKIVSPQGVFTGDCGIYKKSADGRTGSLHLAAGKNKEIIFTLNKQLQKTELLSLQFQGERWTAKKPFQFRVHAHTGSQWQEIYNGDKLGLGKFSPIIALDLKGKTYKAFKFSATTADKSGVLIDNVRVIDNKEMEVVSTEVEVTQIPLLIRKSNATVLSFHLNTEGIIKPKTLSKISFSTKGTNHKNVDSYSLLYNGKRIDEALPADLLEFDLDKDLVNGANTFSLQVALNSNASLSDRIHAEFISYKTAKGGVEKVVSEKASLRIGYNVAHSGDKLKRTNGTMMACKRFRIPGMVTTNKGTVIAVYDLRWKQDRDLPGDLDVGMSRSTDGGKTWEDQRPIMDMGEYLGDSESNNGVGDPAILVDRKTGDIYVVALLAHGLNNGFYWFVSKPGMDPKLTGQCIMIKSTDDGKTWSEPRNITKQVKDPAWSLMLDGPGAGITMRDGTLVFAFQYKSKQANGKFSAQSAIIYSKDKGKTWKTSNGVKYPQETTEAQVVELNDGSLMLNCRISAGGRAVFTSKDMGETWTQHKTSGRGTFNMSGCMSSIIRHSSTKNGDKKDILLFSGPADGGKNRRSHMSIRYSLDEGESWSKPYLLDQLGGAYSCMSIVENNGKKDIAIIYEGSQSNMTYELISLAELMGKN